MRHLLRRKIFMSNQDKILYQNLQEFVDKYLKNEHMQVRKRIYWNLDMDVNHKETLELLDQYLPRIMENIRISEHLKHITDNVLSTRIR